MGWQGEDGGRDRRGRLAKGKGKEGKAGEWVGIARLCRDRLARRNE